MYDYFMEFEEKFYQMFILGTKGNHIKPLLNKGLGGVIFFSHDIQSLEDFKKLVFELKSYAKISPFLSIDQEGGRVERTEKIHNGKKYLSPKFAFQKGAEFLKEQSQQIAKELLEFGLNLNFAPCTDVNTNPNNPIIGERAFSNNPYDVIKGTKIVSEIYRKNGIIPCIKHFPGHGDANTDSHLELPKINLALENMEITHIKPFEELIKNNIEMIMVAHLHCSCFDEKVLPTSLSKNAIKYLRETLNFNGVIVSDDMCMKALDQFGKVEVLEKAILAGVNLFIYRDCTDKTLSSIEKLYQKVLKSPQLQENVEKSFKKILDLKNQFKL